MPVPMHMGSLHPVEQALTLLVAFGPFALLALVAVLRKRRGPTEGGDVPSVPGEDEPQASVQVDVNEEGWDRREQGNDQ